jgi:hypothetical protein
MKSAAALSTVRRAIIRSRELVLGAASRMSMDFRQPLLSTSARTRACVVHSGNSGSMAARMRCSAAMACGPASASSSG